MFESFSHFLSYGSTDQQTVTRLSDSFDGLLVPGTIAAFQAEGTKGFVLSLSARSGDPYVIDSRFPLFQNCLPNPKKSHSMLADVLGAPELINQDADPNPNDFSPELIRKVANNWIEFNLNFDDVQSKTFDKYAARLNEPVLPENRQEPAFVLAPYTMVRSLDDGWREVSDKLWAESQAFAATKGVEAKLRRVVAAGSAELWGHLIESTPEEEIVGWVSDLDEFRPASEQGLVSYGDALKAGSARGQKVFALYGGFFSVLLARYGLVGASHGIGFGEHRDWVELPSSGAPPARYYVPRLHRYVGVEIATSIWEQFPDLIACTCEECNGASPASLDYHALMRHSVRVRAMEIGNWRALPTPSAIETLKVDFDAFRSAIVELEVPAKIARRAEDIYAHLAMWARVLDSLG